MAKFGRMLGTGDGWIEVAVGPGAIAGSHPQVREPFWPQPIRYATRYPRRDDANVGTHENHSGDAFGALLRRVPPLPRPSASAISSLMKLRRRCATPRMTITSGSRSGIRPRPTRLRRRSTSALPTNPFSRPAQPRLTPPSRTPARAQWSCFRTDLAERRGSWRGLERLWRGMATS